MAFYHHYRFKHTRPNAFNLLKFTNLPTVLEIKEQIYLHTGLLERECVLDIYTTIDQETLIPETDETGAVIPKNGSAFVVVRKPHPNPPKKHELRESNRKSSGKRLINIDSITTGLQTSQLAKKYVSIKPVRQQNIHGTHQERPKSIGSVLA